MRRLWLGALTGILLAGCNQVNPNVAPRPGASSESQAQSLRVAGVKFATVNGVKLAYTDEGRGLPVVFVHGFPLSHQMWDAQRAAFKANHRVITVDLAGFGASQAHGGDASMEQFASDLNGLLLQLRTGPAVVVGHSMGGYIALAFAQRYPQALKGLALVSTDANSAQDNPQDTQGLKDLAADVAAKGPQAALEAMAPIMLSPDNHEQKLALDVRALMKDASAKGVEGSLLGMASRAGAKAFMGSIAVPVLVTAGTDDQVIPPAASEQIAAAIKGANLQMVPGAGHMIALEKPAVFNQMLSGFLGRLSTR